MFWGLIMEPQRRYTQQVKKGFHVSMAALDASTCSEEPAQVMCGFEGRNYLLCTLQKPDMLQCPLDLNFDVGSKVSFAANGTCHVHLTGYLTDELLDMPEEEESEDEAEISDTSLKRNKKAIMGNGPPSKKLKGSQVSSSQNQNENSESDDSDLDIKNLLGTSLDDSDDSDNSVVLEDEEDEEDGEEEGESGEEEEESSLSDGSESESEEESEKTGKPKMNGVAKKYEQESTKQKRGKKQKEQEEKENKNSPKVEQKKEVKTLKENQTKTPRKKILQGGVIIEDIREGQGAPAKRGKFVSVYYEGRLKQNNKVFDSTNKGAGFSFRLGNGEVIKGWDIGVAGMKLGGKRRITCPPAMAYGQKGSPPVIPPNSTLVFEVELKKSS